MPGNSSNGLEYYRICGYLLWPGITIDASISGGRRLIKIGSTPYSDSDPNMRFYSGCFLDGEKEGFLRISEAVFYGAQITMLDKLFPEIEHV